MVETVNKLHDKNTKDVNDISVSFLKNIVYFIAEPLSHIFHLSLSNGIFPSAFKMNKIVPVYKNSGKRNILNNYRPITIVNCFGKILEKYVADSLMGYLYRNKIISPSQYGFVKGKNTSDCLLEIINRISKNSFEGKYTAAILLDISKAFDTCNFEVILGKLQLYGIRGVQHDWFESYLSERQQLVKMGQIWSEENLTIDIGVPQGSLLGLILFLIYVNDLPSATEFDSVLYADDTSALMSDSCPNVLEYKCNIQLQILLEWFNANKLSLNFKKTKFLVFSPNLSPSPRLNLYFKTPYRNSPIVQIPNQDDKSVRVLGFWIDERLNFKDHLNVLFSKINKSLFFISKVKNIITLDARKMLYFSHIHSRLIYCLPLFTLLYKSDIMALCQLQRKAIRIAFNAKRNENCIEFFHELGTLPVDLLLEKHIIKTMNLIYPHRKPQELLQYFPLKTLNHGHDIRQNETFFVPLIKSKRLSCAPIYAYPSIFNQFLPEFKMIFEYQEFIEQLELHYINLFQSKNCSKKKFVSTVATKNSKNDDSNIVKTLSNQIVITIGTIFHLHKRDVDLLSPRQL